MNKYTYTYAHTPAGKQARARAQKRYQEKIKKALLIMRYLDSINQLNPILKKLKIC